MNGYKLPKGCEAIILSNKKNKYNNKKYNKKFHHHPQAFKFVVLPHSPSSWKIGSGSASHEWAET